MKVSWLPCKMVSLRIVVLLPLLTGCGQRNEYVAPPPPEVSVAEPTQRDVVDYVHFTGTTRATATVEVRSRVTGFLQSINFKDGATVAKGDLLFVLEQAPFQNALSAAEAELKLVGAQLNQLKSTQADQIRQAEARARSAKAQLDYAEARFRRVDTLARQNTVTEDERQEAVATRDQAASAYQEAKLAWEVARNSAAALMEQAEAQVSAAQAAVDEANLNLSYTRVEAPIAGRVGAHMVDVGNLVTSGTSLLTTIENYVPIHAHFYLGEDDVLRFMEMRRRENLPSIEENPPKLELGLTEGEYPYVGYLDFAELGVDPETGTALRRGIFPNADQSLVPGLFVRIRAPLGNAKPRMMVSARAIAADQRGDYLLVVNNQNVVEYRPVKLGIADAGMVVVESGVNPGELVVVNGLQRARPGTTVAPQKTEMVAGPIPPSTSAAGTSIASAQ